MTPAHGRQLVAGQAQGQDAVRPDGVAHRGQHLTGEPQPVLAVAVGALVGQAGVELAQQRPGAGVDLDPVEPGGDGEPGGLGEGGDDGRDPGGLERRRAAPGRPRRRPGTAPTCTACE